MGLIDRGYLALKFSTGLFTDDEKSSVRMEHIQRTVSSAARLTAVVTTGAVVGFVLPNCFLEPWWPTDLAVETYTNAAAGVRIATGLFGGYWGYCKAAPSFHHHVLMVWNPEAESIAAFKQDIRALFDDAMRLLVTLASLAIPIYLIHKSIQVLLLT